MVSLRELRVFLFIAEHNGLEAWAADVPNACLEASTNEYVCIIAGPDFEPLQECLLIVLKHSMDLDPVVQDGMTGWMMCLERGLYSLPC